MLAFDRVIMSTYTTTCKSEDTTGMETVLKQPKKEHIPHGYSVRVMASHSLSGGWPPTHLWKSS